MKRKQKRRNVPEDKGEITGFSLCPLSAEPSEQLLVCASLPCPLCLRLVTERNILTSLENKHASKLTIAFIYYLGNVFY